MFGRQTSGSVVCPSCGKLNAVDEARCWSCGRPNPGLWGFGPTLRRLGQDLGFVEIILGGCAILYLLTLISDVGAIRASGLNFLAPGQQSLLRFGASGAYPVFGLGRWWTVLSAGWLHGGLLHILFNMMWVRSLLPAVAAMYGPSRTVVLYTLATITGFALSTVGPWLPFLAFVMGRGLLTVGASAAIFGLLGALVYAGRRGVASHVGRQAWTYAIVLFIFGLLFPGVDNWAHLGGFVGGYVGGKLLDPLAPERGDHLLVALACLVLTVGSVVASVLTF